MCFLNAADMAERPSVRIPVLPQGAYWDLMMHSGILPAPHPACPLILAVPSRNKGWSQKVGSLIWLHGVPHLAISSLRYQVLLS